MSANELIRKYEKNDGNIVDALSDPPKAWTLLSKCQETQSGSE